MTKHQSEVLRRAIPRVYLNIYEFDFEGRPTTGRSLWEVLSQKQGRRDQFLKI